MNRTFHGHLTVYNSFFRAFSHPFPMLNRPTTEDRLGKSPQRMLRYFVLLMAVVYMAMGFWLWWSADQPLGGGFVTLGPTVRRVLGAVFIVYGLVRFGRGYQNFRKKTTFNDHD